MAITKTAVAGHIAEPLGLAKDKALDVTELIINLLKERLERGESVLISGFGVFEVKEKKPRRGRNPQTGEDIVISERRVVTFKPSPVLKARLNEG